MKKRLNANRVVKTPLDLISILDSEQMRAIREQHLSDYTGPCLRIDQTASVWDSAYGYFWIDEHTKEYGQRFFTNEADAAQDYKLHFSARAH